MEWRISLQLRRVCWSRRAHSCPGGLRFPESVPRMPRPYYLAIMFPPWTMVAFGTLIPSKRHQWQPLTNSPAGHRKPIAGLASKRVSKAGFNFDKTAGLSQLVLLCWWANPTSLLCPSSHSIVYQTQETQDQVEPCLLGRVAAEILNLFSPSRVRNQRTLWLQDPFSGWTMDTQQLILNQMQ